MTTTEYALLEILLNKFLDTDYVINDNKIHDKTNSILCYVEDLTKDFRQCHIMTHDDYKIASNLLRIDKDIIQAIKKREC